MATMVPIMATMVPIMASPLWSQSWPAQHDLHGPNMTSAALYHRATLATGGGALEVRTVHGTSGQDVCLLYLTVAALCAQEPGGAEVWPPTGGAQRHGHHRRGGNSFAFKDDE